MAKTIRIRKRKRRRWRRKQRRNRRRIRRRSSGRRCWNIVTGTNDGGFGGRTNRVMTVERESKKKRKHV